MPDVTTQRGRATRWVGPLAGLTAAACTTPTAPPPTVRVDRGLVTTSVSASGTLVAITEQNLGFPDVDSSPRSS